MTPIRHATIDSASSTGLDGVRVLTANHRSTGLEALARMSLPSTAQEALAHRLGEMGLEAALLCTCNRIELYWCAHGGDDDTRAEAALTTVLASEPAIRASGLARAEGLDAATHLFRVAAGLESLLVGEAEVLGQVRGAIEAADRLGTAGPALRSLFHAALGFGRRARAETRIGQGALSVASAAVRHVLRQYPDPGRCTVVVVGVGVAGLKAARHLRAEGVGELVLLNRTRERAVEASKDLGARPGSLDELPAWLARADAVVAAIPAEAPVVTAALVRAAIARRRETPLTMIDLSFPRAIAADCAGLEGVVLYDLSGLQEIVADNRALREREVPRVEALLARELAFFESRVRRGGRAVKRRRP